MSDINQYIGSQFHGFDVQEKAILPEPKRPHLLELLTPQIPASLPPHITLFAGTNQSAVEIGAPIPFATIFENGYGVLSLRANEFPLGYSASTTVDTDTVTLVPVPGEALIGATDKRLLYTLTVTNDDGESVSQSILQETVSTTTPVGTHFPATISVHAYTLAPKYWVSMDFPLGRPFHADFAVFTLINSCGDGNVCSSGDNAPITLNGDNPEDPYRVRGEIIWGMGTRLEESPFAEPMGDSLLVTEFFKGVDSYQGTLVYTQIDIVQLPLLPPV